MLHKSFSSEQQHIDPQAEDLALIRRFAQREVTAAEIWTGRQKLANTLVDRAHERFPREYLERFAETLPGKAVMAGHAYDTLPLGRYYAARVQKDDRGHYLEADYYLRADSPHVASIELGILRDVSVGYNAGKRVCDLCEKAWNPYAGSKDGCDHWPGREYDSGPCTLTYCPTEAHKAEAMEGSFVWAGCQYGAEAIPKSMERSITDHFLNWTLTGTPPPAFMRGWFAAPEGAKGMTEQEMQAKLAELEGSHQKATQDLQKQLSELKAQADEGTAYRTFLREEIARFADLLGEEEIWASWAANEKASVEALMPVFKTLGKRVDEKFSGGKASTDGAPDPNALHTPAVPTHQRRRLSWVR